MPRDDLALYLTLSPEFGGTRFGPFEGLEVRLGADRERCHIVLPETFGVSREHCKLIRQGDGGLILAAAERTAAVFVWKGDARRPIQIQTPTAIRPGDSFALVSPEGAKFTVEIAALPPEMLAKRQKHQRGRAGLTGEKLAREGWRMALARVWSIGPVGMAMRAWYLVKSGTLWQPRILITAAIAAFGYMAALAGSCSALKFKADALAVEEDLEQCQEAAGFAKGLGGSGIENRTFDQLAAGITANETLGLMLQKETALRTLVEQKAKAMAGDDASAYDWLFREGSGAAGQWILWRERVQKSESLDEFTLHVLPYTAAVRKRTETDWNFWLDVTNKQSCLRGPARLTYRQARSLGLESVMLDAYKPADAASLGADDAARAQLLIATSTEAGEPPPDPPPASQVAALANAAESCVYAAGDDDRDNPSKVMAVLNRELGREAAAVPDSGNNSAGMGRILKYYAADTPGNKYAGGAPLLDFRNGLATPLKDHPNGEKIMEKAAEAVARSIVLPCVGALDSPKTAEATFGRKADPIACLVLMYRLSQNAGE